MDRVHALLLDQADADGGEVSHHRFDVSADIADFRKLGRLDLDEGSAGELREAAGDFGLANAGRADHEDVLQGRISSRSAAGSCLTPEPVSQGDGDGPFRGRLAHDVAVQLGDDLPGVNSSMGKVI